ncbi:hypothetical protein JW935_03610 [candidate division KSB1 bacterium]|nr:hypothetical protein [candidate division KSB1 bacterium]
MTCIQQEVSDAISQGREGLPLVDRRTVSSTVRVKNGETIVIGGLTQTSRRKIQNKIPFLGDIPGLGYLFGNTKWVNVKTEVVVFIKPTIQGE